MDGVDVNETAAGVEMQRATWRSQSRGEWSTGLVALAVFVIALVMTMLGGCAGRPTLFPNADPALRKTSAEFAADGARRHPYKVEVGKAGDAQARATVDYGLDMIQITNLSNEDWQDVELWVNQNWVVHVPKMEKGAQTVKTINFSMLYDDQGHTFPEWNQDQKNQVHKVELLRGGKMYGVRLVLAD